MSFSSELQTAINQLSGLTMGSQDFNEWLVAAKQYHAVYDENVTGRRELFNVVSYNDFLAGKDPEQSPVAIGGDLLDNQWVLLANDFAQALAWAKEDMYLIRMAEANSDPRQAKFSSDYPALKERWRQAVATRKKIMAEQDSLVEAARNAKDAAKGK